MNRIDIKGYFWRQNVENSIFTQYTRSREPAKTKSVEAILLTIYILETELKKESLVVRMKKDFEELLTIKTGF